MKKEEKDFGQLTLVQRSATNGSSNATSILRLPLDSDQVGDPPGIIRLPLLPDSAFDLDLRILYNWTAAPLNGGQLAASIVYRIYSAWKDVDNLPITNERMETRFFGKIVHIVQPTFLAGAVLTPRQIGISYCWILQGVLNRPAWPGGLIAGIYKGDVGDAGPAIGVITIEGAAANGATDPTTPSATDALASFSSNGTTRVLTSHDTNTKRQVVLSSALAERSWLDCLQKMMFWVVRNAWSGSVLDVVRAGNSAFWRSSRDDTIQGEIYIGFIANRDLTWDHLATSLVRLCSRAAMTENWESGREWVLVGKQVVASVRIGRRLMAGGSGVEAGSGGATA